MGSLNLKNGFNDFGISQSTQCVAEIEFDEDDKLTDEEVKDVFAAQKNYQSYEIINTNIIVLTNKRLIVITKRLIFGYFFRMITPEMFNDLTIKNGILCRSFIIGDVHFKGFVNIIFFDF